MPSSGFRRCTCHVSCRGLVGVVLLPHKGLGGILRWYGFKRKPFTKLRTTSPANVPSWNMSLNSSMIQNWAMFRILVLVSRVGIMSQTHQARTGTEHEWWGYEGRAMDLELEMTKLGTLEVVSDIRALKTAMKKDTRWNATTILDWCVNGWCWIPWKGPRRLQVYIHVCAFNM